MPCRVQEIWKKIQSDSVDIDAGTVLKLLNTMITGLLSDVCFLLFEGQRFELEKL